MNPPRDYEQHEDFEERRHHLDPRYVNKNELQEYLMRPPRTWVEMAAIVAIIATLGGGFTGGIVWGMKMEGRIDALQAKQINLEVGQGEIKTIVSHGILPITEERIRGIEFQVKQIQTALESADQNRVRFEAKIDAFMNALERRKLMIH